MSRHPLFMPLILGGGLVFGFGLGFSHMARPEVVIDFLTFEDFGLLFVMFGGSIVAGLAFWTLPKLRDTAPLTGRPYGRRLKSFDRNVLIGGSIFGVGWGLSGICPGPPTPASVSATGRSSTRSSGCSSAPTRRASGGAATPTTPRWLRTTTDERLRTADPALGGGHPSPTEIRFSTTTRSSTQ